MQSNIRKQILELTQATDIISIDEIQALWNNYGQLSRLYLKDAQYPSIILKHIKILST